MMLHVHVTMQKIIRNRLALLSFVFAHPKQDCHNSLILNTTGNMAGISMRVM